MNEEIVVKFGADLGPLATGMRGVKGMVQSAATSIKDSFKDAFRTLAAPLSLGAGVSFAINSVRDLMNDIQTFKRISEGTGLSLGLTQDLLSLAKASGVASGEVESMIDKFTKGLAPGSDPQTALYAIADKLKDIPDPAERAQLAMETFGKSGAKLIPILKDGADGVRKLADEWGRLSDSEVAELDHANDVLDKSDHQWKIYEAHFLEGAKKLIDTTHKMPLWKRILLGPLAPAEGYREAQKDGPDYNQPDNVTSPALPTPAELNKKKIEAAIEGAKKISEARELYEAKPEEKVLILTRQILALRRQMELTTDLKERNKLDDQSLDIEKQRDSIQNEIIRKAKEAGKNELETAEKLLKLQLSQAEATEKRFRSELQSDAPSLQQLAQSGYQVFRHNQIEWQQGPFAALAQRILNLRADVAGAVTWGNTDRRDYDLKEIERLRHFLPEGLSDSLASPQGMFRAMNDQITKLNGNIQTIADNINKLIAANND